MHLIQVALLLLTISGRAFAPISPGDVDSGWLILATGEGSHQPASEQKSGSPIHDPHSAQSTSDAPTPVVPIEQPVKKRKGQHIKTPEQIERIRAAWTPERRKRQSELARLQTFNRGPEYKAKIRASWTEERRKTQAEITRKSKTGFVHSKESRAKMTKSRLGTKRSQATKDKIREAIKRSHALKKEQKFKEPQ
ncbi:uncharacterized protein FA14DRAFT_155866 [Meira miltonrushii]|uniref:Nuclease associated modular domain-containing protein n=1 Tax=Meira miltonrushii TaxID=1280837 RepID=A0A316V6F2_9BASI|nr:uncharacterized protein FA14DRAFT_155866 [Meira miltonrushii]PWN33167.1 hypothetical protein FA14DRAFT_155866 [Meira miltonrushii]